VTQWTDEDLENMAVAMIVGERDCSWKEGLLLYREQPFEERRRLWRTAQYVLAHIPYLPSVRNAPKPSALFWLGADAEDAA